MKTCLCCGASCAPDASSCPACGEASWRETSAITRSSDFHDAASAPTSAPVSDETSEDASPETPDNTVSAILADPPTTPDAPKGRRSARRS